MANYGVKSTGNLSCTYRCFSVMLEKCKYVRCVFIAFSKAFDVVDHCNFCFDIFIYLRVPHYVVHWIKSFLSGRLLKIELYDSLSSFSSINRSIEHRSGFGSVLFIIFAFYLVALDGLDYFLNYADDVAFLNLENAHLSLEGG